MGRSYSKFYNAAPVPIKHVLIEAPFVKPSSEKKYVLLFLMFTLITMFTGNVYKFAMFAAKHLCWSLFLIKMRAFRSATLLKNDFNSVAFSLKFYAFILSAYASKINLQTNINFEN